MTKEDFIGLLNRYTQGNATPKERQLFDQFVSKMENQPFDWQLEDRERIKLEIYQKIRQQIKAPQKEAKIIRMPMWVRVAASIAIVTTVSLLFLLKNVPSEEITIATTNGKRDTVQLADGSRIYLNVESQITFPKEFKSRKREVKLQGEAFFEVAKNSKRPFIVHSQAVNTTVLGTSFNIKAFADEPTVVTVATGKVQVSVAKYANHKPIILIPNQQVIYDNQKQRITRVLNIKPADYMAWKEGVIQFDRTTLASAIITLKKWYNVELTLADPRLGNCTLSGKYPGDNLTNVLKSIRFIKGIDYRFEHPKKVVLSGKPCQE